ncbi:MAG: phosphotransferase [Variibacter sp.]
MEDRAANLATTEFAFIRALSEFGLQGKLSALPAERDKLFVLDDSSGRKFIVRLSVDEEEPQAIVSQNEVLDAISRVDASLPVPRVMASRSGDKIVWVSDGAARCALRVFSFLPGVPVGKTVRSLAQLRAVAFALARLDRTLSAVEGQRGGNADVWNVVNARSLIPLLVSEPDDSTRDMAKRALERFGTELAPKLETLPHQLIHNDFNTKNVLVDQHEPAKVTGIIDFGDLMYAPRVLDLAVLLSKFATASSPLSDAQEAVAAYVRALPLSKAEIASIYPLLATRTAMRIAVWGDRAGGRGHPGARQFAQDAASLLRSLERVGEAAFTSALLERALRPADA